MITDNIKNSSKYFSIHKDFKKVFESLENLGEDAAGMITLEEGVVWVKVFDIGEVTDDKKVFEAHRAFIDVHYIIAGEEIFGYSNIDRLKQVKPYDSAEDCELLEGEEGNHVLLKKGDFIITFPQDAHIPDLKKIGNHKLVRAVVKVKM